MQAQAEGRRASSDVASRARRATSGRGRRPTTPSSGRPPSTALRGGIKVFAGQRQDGFYVDLGSTFDLADLRPFQNLHLIPTPAAPGVDATATLNIHTIAIQVPISQLTRNGHEADERDEQHAVIGVWSAASRRKVRMIDAGQRPAVRVRALGPGLAPGQSADQRGRRSRSARRTGGTRCTRRATARSRPTTSTRSSRDCCRCSIRRCSRTSRSSSEAARGPGRGPADRDPAGDRPRVPELHRHGAWPTSSG